MIHHYRTIDSWRLLLAIIGVALLSATLATASTDWNEGDVFVGINNGNYSVYDNAGVFKETINIGAGGFTTGCAFNPDRTKLYTTGFTAGTVAVFDVAQPHSIVTTIQTTAQGNAASTNPESIVFRMDGSFFVGHARGDADIHEYDATDLFVQQFNVATEFVGSDWIDLAADQNTIFYTSEGQRVFRFDAGSSTQLTDFNAGNPLPGSNSFALRLLPPGDGSGGLLVADRQDIKRLDASGMVVQSYDVGGEDNWFALNLDPNGTSFWSGDFGTDNFYRFNIATGAVEVGPISVGFGNNLFGICVLGEPTAALAATLTPPLDFNLLDSDHTLTLEVQGNEVADIDVTFSVLDGPNAGDTGMDTTDPDGIATFTYTGDGGKGVDEIQASFENPQTNDPVDSNIAIKFWDLDCQPNDVPDTCDIDCDAFDGECVAFAGCGMSLDDDGNDVPDECNRDPICDDAAATIAELWPPNHEFQDVGVVGVIDPDGDPITISIDSIRQDESVWALGAGAGRTVPDAAGVGTDTASVRAERNGNPNTPGDGRVYHIDFTAEDGQGGSCSGVVSVCAPHDQGRGSECVDGGPLFDSTAGPACGIGFELAFLLPGLMWLKRRLVSQQG